MELTDGRTVVLKIHRAPVDLEAVRVARDAMAVLAAADYPCAVPLAGPDEVDGRVLTAETLVEGRTPTGHEPADRRLLAAGLARHIDLLRGHPDLVSRTGPGPSWCRYKAGPWPVPHDPIVDLSSTPAGYTWLDALARQASEQILTHRDADQVVIGHGDWYAGNTVVADGVLVGTFDWELVADTEAVIAGFAAACFAASSTGGGGMSSPEDAIAFLVDYDAGRGRPFTAREQRAAAGATAWIVAFNARWQVGLIDLGLCDEGTLALARDRGPAYLALSW